MKYLSAETIWIPAGAAVVYGISTFATPFMVLASIAWFLLLGGLFNRKNRVMHSRLMTAGIALDLSLVLILQYQRQAIQTALEFSLGILQQLHIGASLTATLLYIPTLILGWGLYRNRAKWIGLRDWHLRLAISAFGFRTVGFVLMFSLLDKK